MKALTFMVVAATLSFSHFAAAQSKNALAAELYVRMLVRKTSAIVARHNGAALSNQLCAKFSQTMAVDNMAKTITGNAWGRASAADKSSFKKKYVMYLVDKGMDRISANAVVTNVQVKDSGASLGVTAQVQGEQGTRTVTYWLAPLKGLNALSVEELNQMKAGSNSGESKLEQAFRVFRFRVQGRDAVLYIRDDYQIYAKNKPQNQIYPEYFRENEGVSGSCP